LVAALAGYVLGPVPPEIGDRLEKFLKHCLVIGNGESRSNIDLPEIKKNYITVGCNAICRDIEVDHLICCDRRMVEEASKILNFKNLYTRKDWHHYYPKSQCLPDLPYRGDKRSDDPFHWGSGPYSVLIGSSLSNTIHMIGFDLWGINSLVNNVYKGTKSYSEENKRAVDPSYWIYQISKIFYLNDDKYFIVYNKPNWELPLSWQLPNVKLKTLDMLI